MSKRQCHRFDRAYYNFLLAFHSNYGPILYRFSHIARCWSKMAKCIYPNCTQRRRNFVKMFSIGKLEQEVKVIWQKAPHGGPIPRLGVTPGGRNWRVGCTATLTRDKKSCQALQTSPCGVTFRPILARKSVSVILEPFMRIIAITVVASRCLHKRGLCRRAVSVRLSRSCIVTDETSKHILKLFPSSDGLKVLVFPYQTLWQYSDGYP